YGSDAMGGVVNVITRKDFEGASIMVGQASVSGPADGGDRESGSITFGASSDTTSLLGGVSWNNRDIIFARDFFFNSGGASVYGNSYTTTSGGFDNFDWTSIPDGNGGTACDFPGTGFFTLASGGASNAAGTRCAFDFTLVSADEASTGNKSLWLKATHEINDDWSVWANASVNKASSFGRYAPVPDSSYFYTPITAASPNNPTNPAGNVFDATLDPAFLNTPVNIWHRFDAVGNRDNFVDTDLSEIMTGMTGTVGDVELDFGIRKTANKTFDIGYNYLLGSVAFQLIEDGTYDLRNPYGNDEAVLNSIAVTISRISIYDQDEIWFTAAFDAFEMDAGFAQMFVGAEYREEDYNDQYDSLSEAGVVGGSSGNSAGGTRDVTAMYFELLMPVLDNLEVTVAGRQDDYSDYGSDFSPKLSARWVVQDNMTLRASFGEGFRAPTLDILTQKDSFSADSVRDEQSCLNQSQPADCSLQINGLRTANPSLASEQSEQFSFGWAHQPTDWFDYSVDYYSIEITDRINFFSAQELVNKEIAGDPVPAGLGVERSPNGSITRVVQGYGNEGSVETSGLDINLAFNYEALGGRLNHNVQIGHLLEQTVDDGRDLVKDPGLPQTRMVIANTYEMDNFSVGYNLNMIGNQCDDIVAQECIGNVPTWITHDVQFNYFAPWDGKVTVGVRNAGEKQPPVGLGAVGSRDYDFGLYDAYGRITYVQYTQTF
ncbi:MAG: TonB-dependent receptor, partial [Enterobacterales bacterium]|nr:TonB-dependent receptor [Enterobacterales bacterium]